MSFNPYIPTMFAMTAVASSITGSTSETTLFSKTLKAGMMGPNDFLEVITRWTYTNSAATKTLRVKIGTSAYLANVASTSNTLVRRVLIHNRNSLASQVCFGVAPTNDNGITTTAIATFTEDVSVDKTFAITAQNNNVAPTTTLESFLAILWRQQA